MTQDELKKKAEEYAENNAYKYANDFITCQEAFLAGAKEMQKENEQLQKNNKHIRDLIEAERQRQDECNDVHLRDIATLEKENKQLKEQIEKMENCQNCNKYRVFKEFNTISSNCFDCKNKSKWELAE